MSFQCSVLSLRERIDEILPRVAKPARYMGGELNSVSKPFEKNNINFALAFPGIYEVGMSNLGLKILYHTLNKMAGVNAERVFAPALDMESEMRKAGIELFTLDSISPVSSFNIVGFSLSYEMACTSVLNMLDLSGIPIYSKDRTDSHPIIIAGGHCACNPEPMADFIDAFVLGDGEEAVKDVVDAYSKNRGNRANILKALSEVDGVYVPSIHSDKQIQGRVVYDLENAPFPNDLVVPFIQVVHDRVALEIMRGCSRGCRFCQAGMITRPVRERSFNKLMNQAETLLKKTGYDEIALTSLSSADHSSIQELVGSLIDKYEADKVGVSLPSLRADARCVQLAADIQKVRKSGLTFAPEAGTQRLRDVINKNVTEADLLSAVETAVECGWRRIKLYFMIGLPNETDEDLLGIGELVSKVINIGRQQKKPLSINVTISPFVPKPHTPYQWRAMDTLEELERKIALIRPSLSAKNIMLSWHEPACSRIEGALAKGDRALGKVIYKVWESGKGYDQDRFDNTRWMLAFETENLDITNYVNKVIPKDSKLSWDFINMGVSKEFLASEDEKSDKAELTEDCRTGKCSNCGVRASIGGKNCPPAIIKDIKIESEVAAKSDEAAEQIEATALLRFKKTSAVRWLGHLDLIRIFDRAVHMSGLNITFSQGFNPRPKMSIASALPLGATAENEIFTLRLFQPVDLKQVIERINASLPLGIRITDAVLLDNLKAPVIRASEYVIELCLGKSGSLEMLKKSISDMLNEEEIIFERKSENKRRSIDIRQGIETILVMDTPDEGVYHKENEEFGIKALIKVVFLHLDCTVKPSEIVSYLAKTLPEIEILSLHRSALLIKE